VGPVHAITHRSTRPNSPGHIIPICCRTCTLRTTPETLPREKAELRCAMLNVGGNSNRSSSSCNPTTHNNGSAAGFYSSYWHPPMLPPSSTTDNDVQMDFLHSSTHQRERSFSQFVYPSTNVASRAPSAYVPQRLDKLPYGRRERVLDMSSVVGFSPDVTLPLFV
jgi:hypothetical protein